MDQRGKKVVGATASSRGRGTRAKSGRPIPTQSAPRPTQPFSAPRQQPQSTSQQYYYYPQPPSPPRQTFDYPPLNPSDYHVHETSNFNPFVYREQPEGSEDEFLDVPETQFNLGIFYYFFFLIYKFNFLAILFI